MIADTVYEIPVAFSVTAASASEPVELITKEDRRIFTPTPHGSPSWERIYNRRSSLEQINNRIDNSFGFEKHYIRGGAKMQTRVGLAIAVMMAMALGHASAGHIGQMRSLVRPVDKAA